MVDELLRQSITLRNTGALGTNYRLVKNSVLRAEKTQSEVVPPKEKEPKAEISPSSSSLDKQTTSISGSLIREASQLG